MNLLTAVSTGAGLGLACYGSLWLFVRRLPGRAARGSPVGLALTLAVGRLSRLTLAGLTFYALGREQLAFVPAALVGLWLARWHLLRRWGGHGHAP
jgi:hypothetical protein